MASNCLFIIVPFLDYCLYILINLKGGAHVVGDPYQNMIRLDDYTLSGLTAVSIGGHLGDR